MNQTTVSANSKALTVQRLPKAIDMTDTQQQRQSAVQHILGHTFKDLHLLEQACTHSSFCDSNHSAIARLREHNERMEFLGDGLLGAAIGELVFERYPDAAEGELSQCRSNLVSRQTLALAMDACDLIPQCEIRAQMPQPWPDSVKANIAEALLGAIYLDGGWSALQVAVKNLLSDFFDDIHQTQSLADSKNRLQIWALKHHKKLPVYDSTRQGGTDHEPSFSCTVSIASYQATAIGSSKRRSEANAALELLSQIPDEDRT